MLQRSEHENGLVTYRSPRLDRLGLPHAFSTRLGGVSRGPYASLNLGSLTVNSPPSQGGAGGGRRRLPHAPKLDPDTHLHNRQAPAPDDPARIAENLRRLRRAVMLDRHTHLHARQVHGAAVWVPPPRGEPPARPSEADALLTDRADAFLTVRTADCLPVLLASDDGRIVAAVHAGWRGLLAGVIPTAVRHMTDRFAISPSRILAAIGPCIGVEHFEVGPDVADRFRRAGLADAVHANPVAPGPRPHIDLRAAALTQLRRAGLQLDAIDTTDRCTYRHADDFFSWRRDRPRNRATGHMAALIAPRPAV